MPSSSGFSGPVISVTKGTDNKNRVLVKDLSEPLGLPVEVIDNFDADYSLIGNDGTLFYFRCDLNAPRGQVIAIDIRYGSWSLPQFAVAVVEV